MGKNPSGFRLAIACALFFAPFVAFSQQTVTGKVSSSDQGQPLSGASVIIKGGTTGTNTDDAGFFSIQAANGQTLVISYAGYLSKEVLITQTTLGSVTLDPAGSEDEVVVVGYGTQKKVNLTGAVEVIKGEELVNRPTPNLSQSLQGKVSGVNFGTGIYGFEPGAALNVQVRGQGAPLILVDGVVTSSLNGINPNDVESVSLLKDAAASAIYGARAPYGVLLITTKKGSTENKLSIDYSGIYTKAKPLNMPKMLDSYTYALALNEASQNTGLAPQYKEAIIDRILAYQADPINTPATYPASANPNLWGDYFESNSNNNWFDIFYGPGKRSQHNISVSGGNKGLQFFFSGGYVYDGGLLRKEIGTDNYKRYNFTSKFDASLAKWIKVSSNTRYFNTSRNTPAYDNQGNYDLLFHQVARTVPSQAIMSPNGVYRIQSKIPWTRDAGNNNVTVNDIVQRFATEITPAKGWTINADFTVNLTHDAYTSKNFTVYEDNVAGAPVISGSTQNPFVEKSQQLTIYRTFNVYSTYKFNLQEKHNLSVMAGYQQERSHLEYIYAKKTGLVTPLVPTLSTSTGVENGRDNISDYATEGVFGRLNYNFLNKYLLELNGRYDGTYKFADGKKWGFFPSASVGWNISNEGFWSGLKTAVNNFKIRASYGSLGNQLTADAYQDIPLLGVNPNLGWIINGVRPSYVTAPNLINPDVTWETSNTADLGVDISVLGNRLTFTGDIYKRVTKDQLGPQAAVPATIGVATLPQANNRETETTGWEISLNWNDRIGSELRYSVAAQLFDYKTTVTKYNNPTNLLTTSYSGQEVGEIWGLVSKGLIQDQATADAINTGGLQSVVSGQQWQTGDMEYTDLNGDGKITYGNNTLDNPGDRRIIGNRTPRYQFGLTTRLEWKGFDLSMFWQGVAKRDLDLSGNMMWGFTTNNQSSIFVDHLDYYRDAEATKYSGLGENKDAFYPRPYLNSGMNAKNQVVQTRYLLNGAYGRLKNLQIGYNLSEKLYRKIKMQELYIYVSGENLATISSLPQHFDPETANVGSRGDAKSFFPATAYSLGVNVKF
ncbi:TonB-dependent receptor [Niabella insulamsoli]|uniref:SusC/RagA family TonB-linked outer membrane protein n=1 Tax=Niabella insulamsoli TaxID=3144874 RepID=UPI0031FDC318